MSDGRQTGAELTTAGIMAGTTTATVESAVGSVVGGTATQLLAECDAMVRHALGRGLRLPPDLAADLDVLDRAATGASRPSLAEIAHLHGRLGEVVSPAMPRTILLLDADQKRHPVINYFGPLPNIRRLMVMAAGCTFLFILLSLSPYINRESMSKGVYAMQGIELLTVLMFVMTAAAVGACFNALFRAYRYISDGTYDTRYDSSYWMRIGLGIISGLLMAEMIPVEQILHSTERQDGSVVPVDLGKPLLALLGGFSANLVFTVLERLVQTVQSLFQPDPAQSRAIVEHEARSRADQHASQSRMSTATSLIALQDAIAKGAGREELAAMVSQTVAALVPGAPRSTNPPGPLAVTDPSPDPIAATAAPKAESAAAPAS